MSPATKARGALLRAIGVWAAAREAHAFARIAAVHVDTGARPDQAATLALSAHTKMLEAVDSFELACVAFGVAGARKVIEREADPAHLPPAFARHMAELWEAAELALVTQGFAEPGWLDGVLERTARACGRALDKGETAAFGELFYLWSQGHKNSLTREVAGDAIDRMIAQRAAEPRPQ